MAENPETAPQTRRALQTMADAAVAAGRFAVLLARRTAEDRCPETAASLTFTSLLALVPLMAIGLALFSAFPVFEGMRGLIEQFVFANFVPHAGETVQDYLNTFAENTGRLTTVGLIGLGVTALMLLSTIEKAFARIWRVTDPRPFLVRILAFWAILTLGPILFGFSLSISSYLFAAARSSGVEAYTGSISPLAMLAPGLLEFVGFTILYVVIANRPVKWRHAAVGGAVAAVLFELLKKGFGLYIAAFPTYQTLYGTLSVLPIMLIWLYLSWIIALLGAEVAATIPEWGADRRLGAAHLTPDGRFAAALGILWHLASAHRTGGTVKHAFLLSKVDARPDDIERLLKTLVRHKYVARTGRNRWVLSRDLDTVSLYDLSSDLGIGFTGAGLPEREPWQRAAVQLLRQVDAAKRDVMAEPLGALLRAAQKGAGGETLRLAHPEPGS
ncbi:MAG: YihY family inner membrane protein [Minwuiales bacterium]|nr:YihY family inner membrane protein [Minwuiales bacterium]